MKLLGFIVFTVLVATLSSCDSASDGGAAPLYTLNGTVRNDQSIPLTADVKLYAIWSVSSGSPDYSYAFGVGNINATSKTFTLTFSAPPPAQALNSNELGIAYLIATSFPITEGIIDEDTLFADSTVFFGAVNDAAIVYVNGSPDTANYNRDWVKEHGFHSGFNFGKGWYNPGPGFDGFTPYNGPVELLISRAPSDFTFPNWTKAQAPKQVP